MCPMSELLSEIELAAWLHKSRGTLANWRTRGIGPPFVRVGPKTAMYRREDVDAWLREQVVQPAGEQGAQA